MGLKRYIDDVDPETGFTPAIREQLAREGKIIDTWSILQEPEVIAELETHAPHQANFRLKYAESVAQNWQALTDLYDGGNGTIYRMLMQKLHAIYDEDGMDEEVLDHKAKLLMKNIVTRWSIGRNQEKWKYDKHQERVIAITERAYGPFPGNIDHFLVSSFEGEGEVLENIRRASGLIRQFRREGGIPDDPSDILLIDNQAVVKHLIPNASSEKIEAEWQKLQTVALDVFSHINWDSEEVMAYRPPDVRAMWYQAVGAAQLTDGEDINPIATNNVNNAIWEIFDRMRSIMRNSTFGNHLKDGKTIVLNSVMDQNGRARMIIPLIPHANGHHAGLIQ